MSADILKNEGELSIESVEENIIITQKSGLNKEEDERLTAIRIINNINNEMQPEMDTHTANVNPSLSLPVISTPKVNNLTNANRIRIINSSDLIGKTLHNNNVAKIINVSSTGDGRDFIKLVSGSKKHVHNIHSIPILSTTNNNTNNNNNGPSAAKIIRIKSEKDSLSPSKISLSSVNNSINNNSTKKIVTIQAACNTVTKTPLQVQMNRNTVKLSPKTFTIINNNNNNNTNPLLSTTLASSSSTSATTGNFILLTQSFGKKAMETTSSLLRPAVPTSTETNKGGATGAGNYERYESERSQRMEVNSVSNQNSSAWQQYVRQYAHMGPCPICEDSISGYHYGIFCCESCKGFFKRSVQNHKDYVCHVQQQSSSGGGGGRGEPCGINRHTRKKCPSCRFQRCVDKGMRIEAVRNDRSRGGRSLYPGSRNRIHRYSFPDSSSEPESQLNHNNNKTLAAAGTTAITLTPSGAVEPSRYVSYFRPLSNVGSSSSGTVMTTALSSNNNNNNNSITTPFDLSRNLSSLSSPSSITNNNSNGPLHRALSSRGRTSMMSVLDNIVVIEEQLQQERDVLGAIVEDDDMAVYKVLLKLAEQRLHRMVRWSRALPEFSAIDTDDQIMLVQNCWAELLILDCCYRSLGDPREIHLTSGKCINLEAACELGAKDIVEFVLRTTQKLKSLKLDIREYACMKVLLLMQPDLRSLKAEGRVRMFQETISQLLLDYTNHNYESEMPNKFYDLVVCIPEIREAANSVKEMLISKDLSPFLTSNSLLLELLNCNNNINNNSAATKHDSTVLPTPLTVTPPPPTVTCSSTFKHPPQSIKIISISNNNNNNNQLYSFKNDLSSTSVTVKVDSEGELKEEHCSSRSSTVTAVNSTASSSVS